MITSMFNVKFIHGAFDGLSEDQPDATFDSSKGYSVGFALLVEDGTSWTCSDDSVGTAVWAQDESDDAAIEKNLRELTCEVPAYCNNYWIDTRYGVADTGLSYAGNVLTRDQGELSDNFFVGDTINVIGARRNSGVYDIVEVDETTMTVSPKFPVAMTDEYAVSLYASVFPVGVQDITAKMVEYNVWVRPDIKDDLSSENVGNYSYTQTTDVGGMNYPNNIVAPLMLYKRMKVR